MNHIFHLPEGYSFQKVGIKGKIFDTKSLSDEVEFSVIETERATKRRLIEKECIFRIIFGRVKVALRLMGRKRNVVRAIWW